MISIRFYLTGFLFTVFCCQIVFGWEDENKIHQQSVRFAIIDHPIQIFQYNQDAAALDTSCSTPLNDRRQIAIVSQDESDSMIVQIIDSLNIFFQRHTLSDIACGKISNDDVSRLLNEEDVLMNDSLAIVIGEKSGAQLVVWWLPVNSPDAQPHFQTVINIIEYPDSPGSVRDQQNTLATTTGHSSYIKLGSFEPSLLAHFITGLVLYQQANFSKSVAEQSRGNVLCLHAALTKVIDIFQRLKNNRPLPDDYKFYSDFYLASAYLQLSKLQKDISLAKATLDTAIQYYSICLTDSDNVARQEQHVWILNNCGVAYQLLGDLTRALNHYELALVKMNELPLTHAVSRIYNNIGNLFLVKGEWSKALDVYRQSIAVIEKSGNEKYIAQTYDHVGDIYQLLLQQSNALDYYQKSLALREKTKDSLGIAISYQNLADTYFDKKDYLVAFDYYQKELTVNQSLHNEPRVARTMDNLGKVYQSESKNDSAQYLFQQSLELYESTGDHQGIIRASTHLAEINYKTGHLEKALMLYEKSMSLAQTSQDDYELAKIYDRIADIYNKQENWEEALEYYQRSAERYEALNSNETLALILFNMGLIHVKQKNYMEARRLIKRAIDIDEKNGYQNLKNEKGFLRNLEMMMDEN